MWIPLFRSTYEGSLCGAGPIVHSVWPNVLTRLYPKGSALLNPVIIAAEIGRVTPEEVQSAIDFLCSPDPESRTPGNDGRRLLKIGPMEYEAVNFAHYQAEVRYSLKKDYDKRYAAQKRAGNSDADCVVVSSRIESPKIAYKRREEKRREEEKTTSSSSSGDDAFLKNVLDFWESSNLTPACRALSKARRSSILARRKEHGEAAVFEVLKNRKDSNFLTFVFSDGRGAGIDWVFGPKNFVKILDGTYNDAPRSADQTDEMTMTFRRLAQKFGCTAEDMKAYWDKEGATPTTKEQVDRFLEVPF